MTPAEAAIVRDLRARLRLAEDRIRYLERDKKNALARARTAVDQGRYWYGIAIGVIPMPEQKKAS